ncbi:MAG TPA: GAF domain-containing protein [Polyangiaceae bacterium]
MTAEKKGRPSDPPVPELKKERDAFIQTFFQKGAQFTQELVNENSRLRHRLGELEQEVGLLRAQVASDDAIRELLKKIEALERDKRALLSRYEEAEAASSRWLDQYAEVEGELANFANLYVASYQLHASLSFRTTVRQIKELLEQLVGARVFAVYLSTSDGRKLVPVVGEGVGSPRAIPVNPDDDGIGEVFSTGVARVERGDLRAGSLDNPIALVPIKMEDKVVGVFAIYATLEQKSQFLPVDFELFKLLGAHAAEALVCARLFDDAGHRLPSFDSFFDSHM